MAEPPHESQSPSPPPGDANPFVDVWSAWFRSAAGAVPVDDPLEQLAKALSGYAGAVSAPLRDLAAQQHELAESMEEWARLQQALAEQVLRWAQQQRKLASTLTAVLAPLEAFDPPRE
jgi:hypothetical protein